MKRNIWGDWFSQHTQHRQSEKPRSSGMTMVMDKGLGMRAFDDLIEMAHPYIDFYKLGFGTSALTPTRYLQEKIEIAQAHQIQIYPGGTFFEIAYAHRSLDNYLTTLQRQGFTCLEISEGTLSLSPSERRATINKALSLGFSVITEVGSKATGSYLTADEIYYQAKSDLEEGAQIVIIEGRESGLKVGLYDEHGQFDPLMIHDLVNSLPIESIMFEAPLKNQQAQYIQIIGHDVNIGNISPFEVIALEALRQHLRADTFNPNLGEDQ